VPFFVLLFTLTAVAEFMQVLVVVSNLDVVGIMPTPHETDAILIVDPNTVLPLAIAMKLFETIPGRYPQIVELNGSVKHDKFASGDPRRRGAVCFTTQPDFRRVFVGEGLDHLRDINVSHS
jgi:hypothetical protein